MRDDVHEIAARFGGGAAVEAVTPIHGGHINDSYLVTWAGLTARHVLQRLNPDVFQKPVFVMDNIVRVTRHLAATAPGRHVQLVPAADGRMYCEIDGAVWRMSVFIEHARCLTAPRDRHDVYAAATAFGAFHRVLASLPAPQLHEVIPGFHDTTARCVQLQHAIVGTTRGRLSAAGAALHAAECYRGCADALQSMERANVARRRIVHNDAKLANVLFDHNPSVMPCVIDLDTVMPGLILHDVGDMIRTMTSTASEDGADDPRAVVDPDLYAAVVDGYRTMADGLLTPTERKNLLTAGIVVTYEQGVRFLTDYLLGDPYYRVDYPEHNLRRSLRQFRLLASLDAHGAELRAV